MTHRARALSAIGVLLCGAMLTGCSPRQPARSAAHGVIDALVHPDPRDALAVEIRDLIRTNVRRALAKGPPPAPREVARDMAEGIVGALAEALPEQRDLLRSLVSDAVAAGVGALVGPEGEPSRSAALSDAVRANSAAAGRSLGAAMADQLVRDLEAKLGSEAEGPLGDAMAAATRRSTAAAVRGATEQLAMSLGECKPDDPTCGPDVAHRIGRSVAAGAAEGVDAKLGIWPLALALALGLGVGGLVGLAFARRRRERPPRAMAQASPEDVAPAAPPRRRHRPRAPSGLPRLRPRRGGGLRAR